MRYLRIPRPAYYRTDFLSEPWGPWIEFLEIDDQRALRQVNVHAGGQILRYDRSHWCDDYGHMSACRFSRQPKAARNGEFISAEVFEQQWKFALKSPLWLDRQLRSRERSWGTWAQHTWFFVE